MASWYAQESEKKNGFPPHPSMRTRFGPPNSLYQLRPSHNAPASFRDRTSMGHLGVLPLVNRAGSEYPSNTAACSSLFPSQQTGYSQAIMAQPSPFAGNVLIPPLAPPYSHMPQGQAQVTSHQVPTGPPPIGRTQQPDPEYGQWYSQIQVHGRPTYPPQAQPPFQNQFSQAQHFGQPLQHHLQPVGYHQQGFHDHHAAYQPSPRWPQQRVESEHANRQFGGQQAMSDSAPDPYRPSFYEVQQTNNALHVGNAIHAGNDLHSGSAPQSPRIVQQSIEPPAPGPIQNDSCEPPVQMPVRPGRDSELQGVARLTAALQKLQFGEFPPAGQLGPTQPPVQQLPVGQESTRSTFQEARVQTLPHPLQQAPVHAPNQAQAPPNTPSSTNAPQRHQNATQPPCSQLPPQSASRTPSPGKAPQEPVPIPFPGRVELLRPSDFTPGAILFVKGEWGHGYKNHPCVVWGPPDEDGYVPIHPTTGHGGLTSVQKAASVGVQDPLEWARRYILIEDGETELNDDRLALRKGRKLPGRSYVDLGEARLVHKSYLKRFRGNGGAVFSLTKGAVKKMEGRLEDIKTCPLQFPNVGT